MMTMPRKPPQRFENLRALDPSDSKTLDTLRAALQSATGPVIATAARIIEENRLDGAVPDLGPAFERLCTEGAKRDPSCRGKLAIAHALHALDYWEDAVFVGGLTYAQKEGWGAEDTAGELRGICGIAHAHFAREDALDVLAGLLADPHRAARVAAARGIGDSGRRDATAMLRLKLLIGDDEPAVLSACIESLFALSRDDSYPFVVALLSGDNELAEVAALALGGSRIAAAFDELSRWCIGCKPEQRHRVGYLALALLRTDVANDYLLDAIRSHGAADAIAAARALATFKEDVTTAERVLAAAEEQKLPAARDEIIALFR